MSIGKRSHNKNWKFLSVPPNRSAQMEMVGLVVIVILITLGMLFLATFAFKSNTQKKIFTRKGLAYSTMSAVMKTSISENAQCAQIGVPKIGEDMIDDCAKYSGAGEDSQYHCIGPMSGERLHSCDFLKEMVFVLLNDTLGKWNKKYEFTSQLIRYEGDTPENLIEPIGEDVCPKWKDRDSSGSFFINTEAGLVENHLYLCD